MNIFPYHILLVVASVTLSCVHCEPMFRAMRQIVRPVNHEKGSVLGGRMRQFIRPGIHSKNSVLGIKRENFPRISRPIKQEKHYEINEKDLAESEEALLPIPPDHRRRSAEREGKTSVIVHHEPRRVVENHRETQPTPLPRTQSPVEIVERAQSIVIVTPNPKSTESTHVIGLPEMECPKSAKKKKTKFSLHKLFKPEPDPDLNRLMCLAKLYHETTTDESLVELRKHYLYMINNVRIE